MYAVNKRIQMILNWSDKFAKRIQFPFQAVVLFAMGGYGTYLGFRIRFSDDVVRTNENFIFIVSVTKVKFVKNLMLLSFHIFRFLLRCSMNYFIWIHFSDDVVRIDENDSTYIHGQFNEKFFYVTVSVQKLNS